MLNFVQNDISLVMDCFPSAYAPGVSAAAPDGMLPHEVQSLFKTIFESGKVISMDIVETNPEFDDGRTAKLAATMIYDVVTNLL
jgi:formiminoglutamase